MKILLATITRNRKGQPARAERTLEAEAPALGRGAQCVIHLPDPRVALEHATIFMADGAQRIAGVGSAVLIVDGRSEGELVLAPGSRFELGPYQFIVETPPSGYDLALSCELIRPMPDDLAEIRSRSRFSLTPGGVSKRAVAWGLFGTIAVLLLVLPIVVAVTPPLRAAAAKLKVPPDLVWNSGPLSTRHAEFARQCADCHELPFLRVRDSACLACHKGDPAHVRDAALQKKLFGGTRCGECHAEHQGGERPVRTDSGLCTQCHANLKARLATTSLENVGDFVRAHPEFRLTLWRGPGKDDYIRVAQTNVANYHQQTRLKYPHDVHLKPGLRAPNGRVTLTCDRCHVREADGKTFKPTDMNHDCIECHKLNFEPYDPARQVDHGSAQKAWDTINDFYSNIELQNAPVDKVNTGDIQRTIPNPSARAMTDAERLQGLTRARERAATAGAYLFENDKSGCRYCHDVGRVGEPHKGSDGVPWEIACDKNAPASSSDSPERSERVPWEIACVHIPRSFMPKARFDHERHRTGKDKTGNPISCASCHESVLRSKSAADLAIPGIDTCRVCHGGNAQVASFVPTSCESCHRYHREGAMKPVHAQATPPASKDAKP